MVRDVFDERVNSEILNFPPQKIINAETTREFEIFMLDE